jgi:hypothetical protein
LTASVKALAETDLPALNKLMNESGVTHVTMPPVTAPRRTPPGEAVTNGKPRSSWFP